MCSGGVTAYTSAERESLALPLVFAAGSLIAVNCIALSSLDYDGDDDSDVLIVHRPSASGPHYVIILQNRYLSGAANA